MRGTWGVVLVLGLVVFASVGAAQPDEYDCPVDTDDVEEPGAELANVVGAQEIVVARELERRGFNATLANASNPQERATVVGTELERIDARLTDLETCRDALVEARRGGALTAREYTQRAGTLEPDVTDVDERLDRAEEAASDLSPELRTEHDIGQERFDALDTRTSDLETFVTRPGQAIEAADPDAGDQELREPTLTAPGESTPETTETDDGQQTEEEEAPEDGQDTETAPEPATETETPEDPSQGGDDEDDGESEGEDLGRNGSSDGAVPSSGASPG